MSDQRISIASSALLGAEGKIPRKVAVCPECGRTLHYTVTVTYECDDHDEVADVDLDCRAPIRNRYGDYTHRFWQSDWQEVMDLCRAWVQKKHTHNKQI